MLGTYSTGFGEASSEIAAYDKQARRVFVTNAASKTVDILDVRMPAAPTRIARIEVETMARRTASPCTNGIVAVAIESAGQDRPRHVAFYTTTAS